MNSVSEELMEAAKTGDQVGLQQLLIDPDCDAKFTDVLAQDYKGFNALMRAAHSGHTHCVQLLLPASDTSAKSHRGDTSSSIATNNSHIDLAHMINAYGLAMSELVLLHSSTAPATAIKLRSLRV